jgi:hypothetical protein
MQRWLCRQLEMAMRTDALMLLFDDPISQGPLGCDTDEMAQYQIGVNFWAPFFHCKVAGPTPQLSRRFVD